MKYQVGSGHQFDEQIYINKNYEKEMKKIHRRLKIKNILRKVFFYC